MFRKLEFITPTFLSVLTPFLEDPGRQYHLRELVRKTRISLGSANKNLKLLVANGFLVKERRGRMVFYRLNTNQPVVRQFKIFLNVYTLGDVIEKIKADSRRIVLFGSVSQGTDAKESDVDLLILTQNKDAVRKEVNEFNRKNIRKIASITVNANEYAKLRREDKPLHENIEKGIVLWQAGQ